MASRPNRMAPQGRRFADPLGPVRARWPSSPALGELANIDVCGGILLSLQLWLPSSRNPTQEPYDRADNELLLLDHLVP
jgi:hypothetical protein